MNAERYGPRLLSPSDLVLVALLVGASVVLGASELAGLALAHRLAPPRVALRALVSAARGHAAIWPGTVGLGRVPFLALSAGVVLFVVAVAVLFLRRRLARRTAPGFATTAELARTATLGAARRAAFVTRPSIDPRRAEACELGYPLGIALSPRGLPLVASWEHSLQVVAPPGAGKTLRVLAPILRQHPGPALATSTKADLYEVSAAARAKRGPVFALDPEHLCPGAEPLRWSPLSGCLDARVAERRATALVAAAGDGSDVRGGAFFRRSAAAVLAAYLHAAACVGASMRDVCSWAERPSDPAPLRALLDTGSDAAAWAARLEAHTTGAAETTSGVMRTVDLALGCFADPEVLSACEAASDAPSLRELLEDNATIFALGKDRGALGGVAPFVTAFCDELVVAAEELAMTTPTGRLDPPLLCCLDEAPQVAPLPALPSLLADGRGRGITTVIAMQSFSQAEVRWGKGDAQTMRNAASILLVLGGLSVADDLEELARLAGTRRTPRVSWSDDPRNRSQNVHVVDEPVVAAAEVRTMPDGAGFCLWGRLPVIKLHLPALFEGPDAAEIAEEERAARQANRKARDALAVVASAGT